ncbi:MAG: ABC transporter substrate-binding protein [Ramlibacter sp.]
MADVLRRGLVFLLLALGALGHASALQVTDDRGVTVTLPQAPRRIVTLLPSLTEVVCALGQCDRLVGVDRYSDYPATVRALPQLGGGLDPNIEAVVALRPDVVLMATSSRAVQRLESLGLKVVALEPHDVADVRRVIARVGQVLDVPDAQRLWREIDAGVNTAAASIPPAARNIRVYFEVGRGPYAAGEASFIGETLARLGARNIVPRSEGPFPKINPEFVVRADPDLIMISQNAAPQLEQRPGWASLRALREGRLCVFSPEDSAVLVRPGPRMAQAARLMAQCISRRGAGSAR